jgi:hypothetical protein
MGAYMAPSVVLRMGDRLSAFVTRSIEIFNDVAVDIASARGAFGFDLTTAFLSLPR